VKDGFLIAVIALIIIGFVLERDHPGSSTTPRPATASTSVVPR
jgi:hypothetical protein